jgi:hypothetical protein
LDSYSAAPNISIGVLTFPYFYFHKISNFVAQSFVRNSISLKLSITGDFEHWTKLDNTSALKKALDENIQQQQFLIRFFIAGLGNSRVLQRGFIFKNNMFSMLCISIAIFFKIGNLKRLFDDLSFLGEVVIHI